MKRTGIWLIGLLIVAILTTAITVVYVKYQTRLLFVDLQALRIQRQDLDVEWDNLLLEQAAQANIASVERRARHHLDMHIPERSEVRLIEGIAP